MKQTLELKLGQKLAMTPQLQQAIRLLQLSVIDLRTEIQTALDNNPLLDTADQDEDLAGPETTETDSEDAYNSDKNGTEQQVSDNSDEISARRELYPPYYQQQ